MERPSHRYDWTRKSLDTVRAGAVGSSVSLLPTAAAEGGTRLGARATCGHTRVAGSAAKRVYAPAVKRCRPDAGGLNGAGAGWLPPRLRGCSDELTQDVRETVQQVGRQAEGDSERGALDTAHRQPSQYLARTPQEARGLMSSTDPAR